MLCHGMLLRTDYIVFRYFIRLVWLYHVMMYFPSPYFALLSFNWCCKWFCVTLRYFILRDFPSLHLMSRDFKLLYACCSLPYFTSLYFSLHYFASLHFSWLYFILSYITVLHCSFLHLTLPSVSLLSFIRLYLALPYLTLSYLTLLSFFLLCLTSHVILFYFTVHLTSLYTSL